MQHNGVVLILNRMMVKHLETHLSAERRLSGSACKTAGLIPSMVTLIMQACAHQGMQSLVMSMTEQVDFCLQLEFNGTQEMHCTVDIIQYTFVQSAGMLTGDEVEAPRDSWEEERDFESARSASADSLGPACALVGGVLSFLLSLMVPGKERPLRKLHGQ